MDLDQGENIPGDHVYLYGEGHFCVWDTGGYYAWVVVTESLGNVDKFLGI